MADRTAASLEDPLAREIDQVLEEQCGSWCLDDALDRQRTALVLADWIRDKEDRTKRPAGPWIPPPEGFWRTKSGKLLPIVEMSDDHLCNCLKLIQRKAVARAADEAVELAMSAHMACVDNFDEWVRMLPKWHEIAEKWPWWKAMVDEAGRRGLEAETSLANEEYVRHLQMAHEARLLAEKEARARRSNRPPWYYWHKDPEQRKLTGGQLCSDCYNQLFSRSQAYHEHDSMAREDYEPVPPHKRTPYPSCECEVPF